MGTPLHLYISTMTMRGNCNPGVLRRYTAIWIDRTSLGLGYDLCLRRSLHPVVKPLRLPAEVFVTIIYLLETIPANSIFDLARQAVSGYVVFCFGRANIICLRTAAS